MIIDHIDVAGFRIGHDRGDTHRGDRLIVFFGQLHRDETVRRQVPVGIFARQPDRHRAGGLVHPVVDEIDGSLPGIGFAVGRNDGDQRFGLSFRIAEAVQIIAFGNRKTDIDRVDLNDIGQRIRSRRRHIIAHRIVGPADLARDRSIDLGVAQFIFGPHHRRLGFPHFGLGEFNQAGGVVQFGLRHRLLVE
ncbi:hypothetical protein SDC9_193333 [bioreactor metagenome]|uniref:Uncharacterized protein n=1 Tax=bioreactor metagenome TaxID=1076179 RepID=A0A645I4T1_9ZZZZ